MPQTIQKIKDLESHTQNLNNQINQLKRENEELSKRLKKELRSNKKKSVLSQDIIVNNDVIKNQESKFSKIIELVDCGIIFLDKNGIVQDCNIKSLTIFSFSDKKELIGKTIEHRISKKDRTAFGQALQQMVENNIPINITCKAIKKRGEEFICKSTASLIDKKHGIYVLILQNLSDKCNAEMVKQEHVELMGNLSIFRMGVYKAESIDELKNELCEIAQMYTNADRVWLLEKKDSNYPHIHYSQYSKKKDTYEYYSKPVEGEISEEAKNKLKKCILRVNSFQSQGCITFEYTDSDISVEKQYILSFNTKSGIKYYWGFDYSKNKSIVSKEVKFLEKLTPIVQPAFNSLEAYERLAENEARFRAFAEKQSDIILVRNKEGYYTYASPSVRKYGITPENVLGKSFIDFIHPDDKELADHSIKKIIHVPGKSIFVPNLRICVKQNTINTIQATLTNLLHQKGVEGIVINIRDVTAIIKAYNVIAHSEEKFKNIFENSSDAIFITGSTGSYLEVNKKGIALLGEKKKITNTKFQNAFGLKAEPLVNAYLDEINKNGESSIQTNYITETGQTVYVEVNGKTIKYEGNVAIINISRDISLRKEMERKILEASIKTEENERSRFAQDLHDDIGPYLSATKFFLKTLSDSKNVADITSLAGRAIVSIDEIIIKIKEISNNISPHVLRNFGIISAIHSFRKKLRNNNIEISVYTNLKDSRFDENIEVSVFRIVIELINNTLKYAEAKNIDIHLNLKNNSLKLEFSHNGKGFDFDKIISENKGQGLFNVINRVNILHGKYSFQTSSHTSLYFNAIFEIT